MRHIISIAMALFLYAGLEAQVVDIDGNIYKTVKIGTQTWMAGNLTTTKYNDGYPIPNVRDDREWYTNPPGAYCYYDNNKVVFGDTQGYGALYNWSTVNPDSNGGKNVCPKGWHVPTDAEWTVLITYLGDPATAGGKLKEAGTGHWISPNAFATNETGFTAIPGGLRLYNGKFLNVGRSGHWWAAPDPRSGKANDYSMDSNGGRITPNPVTPDNGESIRCIKD